MRGIVAGRSLPLRGAAHIPGESGRRLSALQTAAGIGIANACKDDMAVSSRYISVWSKVLLVITVKFPAKIAMREVAALCCHEERTRMARIAAKLYLADYRNTPPLWRRLI
jgi:hypothetical protein